MQQPCCHIIQAQIAACAAVVSRLPVRLTKCGQSPASPGECGHGRGLAGFVRRSATMTLIHKAGAVLVLSVMPALAAAQDVTYDFDRARNFAQVRSFALRQETKSDNPLVDQRILSAISSELSAR